MESMDVMKPATEPEVEFESLKCLLLDMAQERSLDALLNLIVNRLVELPHMALVRIWLARPGDICASCRMREECPDQTSCLHLVASAGNPLAESGADWSRLDGDFRRFPFGVRKVGHIAATGEPVEITDARKDSKWLARPDWAEREGIQGFAGQPLLFKGEVLGVIAVFTRTLFVHEGFIWLRMIADHTAASIANARAFEEIERLQKQLELENAYLKEEVSEAKAFGDIIGESPALRQVLDQMETSTFTTPSTKGSSTRWRRSAIARASRRYPRPDRRSTIFYCGYDCTARTAEVEPLVLDVHDPRLHPPVASASRMVLIMIPVNVARRVHTDRTVDRGRDHRHHPRHRHSQLAEVPDLGGGSLSRRRASIPPLRSGSLSSTHSIAKQASHLETSSNPSSFHPSMPPIISFTGKPRDATRTAALFAPLQCGPAQ